MSHRQSNNEMDSVTTRKAQGLRLDDWNDDDWTCSQYCTLAHEHRYRNGNSIQFNMEKQELCQNNCNKQHKHIRSYRELSQIQKNRNKKGNGEMQYGEEFDEPLFKPMSYRRRRRPRKAKYDLTNENNNNNNNNNGELRKFDRKLSQQRIKEAEDAKLVRIESNRSLNDAKKLFDRNESIVVKSIILDQQRNKEAISKQDKEIEIEKGWADTINNISNIMFAEGDILPESPRKNRMQIKQRFENELSQKLDGSIFENIEFEDDEKRDILDTIKTNKQGLLNASIKQKNMRQKRKMIEKQGMKNWEQFVIELKKHSDEANGFKARIDEIKLIQQKNAIIDDKKERNEDLSEEEKVNEMNGFQKAQIQMEFEKISTDYEKLQNDLKLFENEMIDLQKVTKPTLKHFQAMNKIDRKLKKIKVIDENDEEKNQANIDYNSLRWDWSKGGWFHKNMTQYQTKCQILNLAAANKIKPRERNQIIIRNIASKINSISDFNCLIEDFIDEMSNFARSDNKASIWEELTNHDLVDFKSHIVDFEAFNEWKQYLEEREKEEEEKKDQNGMQDFYNETGLILRIFINNDGPFTRRYSNNWKEVLQEEFNQFYARSKQIFGKYATIDFNDVQETYVFWMHMPKKQFSNRKGIIQEMKNIVIKSKTNTFIGENDIISVKRSNPKFPERVYFTVKGSIPDKLPDYFGSKYYFWAKPVAEYKVFSPAQRCMSWVPQCDVCMYLGHRRGMSCPHLRKLVSYSKNLIENIAGISREEKNHRKKTVRICSFGCTYCSDKNHTADKCTNEAYCVNCNENHPALKDFDNCRKLKELGLTIYQYEDDYKAARMSYMKAPRKPEKGEYVELSPIWKETHSIEEAVKMPEFCSLKNKFLADYEIINNYKRNLAILSKLKMKVLFTKEDDELELINDKIDEINVLKDGKHNKIDEILREQHVETIEEIVEKGRDIEQNARKEMQENKEKEKHQKPSKMEIDKDEESNDNNNDVGDIEMGNNNNSNESQRDQEKREELLLTPKNSDFEASGQEPSSLNLSQNGKKSKSKSKSKHKDREKGNGAGRTKRKKKDKHGSRTQRKSKNDNKVSDGMNSKSTIAELIKIKNKNDKSNRRGTSMRAFIGAAVGAAGIGGAKMPDKLDEEAEIRNEKQMTGIINKAVDEISVDLNVNNNNNNNSNNISTKMLDKIISQDDIEEEDI